MKDVVVIAMLFVLLERQGGDLGEFLFFNLKVFI